MALMGRTQIGMKATGTTVTIPNNPKGKLMYYLSCIKNVLQMDDEIADMNRLTRYNQYYNLSDSDTDLLIVLGLALSPDVLMNKCIFQSDAMCGDSSNEFYEIEAVRSNLLVAGSVMIGGRSRRVSKIMTFKMSWLKNNWAEPIKQLVEEQERRRAASAARRRREESSGCTVM